MKGLNNQRLRLVLTGLLCFIGVMLLSVTLFAGTIIGKKSHELVNLKLQNKVVDSQLLVLAQSKKEVKQYSYFNDIAKAVLPADKDQAQAVLDIFQLAADSGISIASISFPASTLGAKNSSQSTKSTSSNAATAPVKSVISQSKAIDGIPGLYGVDLTISPETGPSVPDAQKPTYGKLLDFLSRIEHNRRTAQITQVNIQPTITDTGPGPFINFTLTTKIFIKP